MKSRMFLIATVIALGLGGYALLQQRDLARAKQRLIEVEGELAQLKSSANAAEDSSTVQVNAAELQRLRDERAELIKLRGEVSALRREKEEWDKKLVAERASAAAAAAASVRRQQEQAQPAAPALEAALNSPPGERGAFGGSLRRKILNREPLNASEQALLAGMMAKAPEIEKSPEEFAAFQTGFISSLLGWQNDQRAEHVQQVLLRASTMASQRGFDYNSPALNADGWNEEQKALNTRATRGVQNILSEEERAVFDQAFLGVMGIDFGMTARPQ